MSYPGQYPQSGQPGFPTQQVGYGQQPQYPPQQGGYPGAQVGVQGQVPMGQQLPYGQAPQGQYPQQNAYPGQVGAYGQVNVGQQPYGAPQQAYPPSNAYPQQGYPPPQTYGQPTVSGYAQGQPAYGQPAQTAYGQPAQPAYGQPAYGQPQQGAYPPAQPAYGQPAYGQPAQPAYGQPAYGQPAQPAYGQPVQQVGVAPGGQQYLAGYGLPLNWNLYTSPVNVMIPPYNAEPDAEALYRAMKGLGTNDKILSNIMATRSRDQVQAIRRVFVQKYGKTLEHWIKGETSGHYEDLLIALVDAKDEYDAHLLKDAVKGLGTNDHQLIEVICTRTNSELIAMKGAYQRLYHKSPESDVSSDTSGDYKNLLLAILQANRPESQPPNVQLAKTDAQRLYSAGEGRMGTDERTFIEILTQRSLPQVHLTAECYGQIARHSLESGISKETSGNFKKAMITLITPKDEYFAMQLHSALAGMGTDDKRLVRCLSYLSSNPLMFRAVNDYYMHRFKHNIANDVAGDTSGWYKKTAIALINSRTAI